MKWQIVVFKVFFSHSQTLKATVRSFSIFGENSTGMRFSAGNLLAQDLVLRISWFRPSAMTVGITHVVVGGLIALMKVFLS
jgi:hypothetical protein